MAAAGIGLDHPVAFSVMFALHDPRDDGLISAKERPAVTALEDEIDNVLASVVGQHGDPWFVGSRTEHGSRYLFYYLPVAVDEAPLGREWEGGYLPRYRIVADPEWREYRDNVAPTPFQQLLIASNKQLYVLAQAGDLHVVERVVDHTAVFADSRAAADGAKALRAAGFTVAEIADGVVSCRRSHNLGGVTVEQVMLVFIEAIEPHGGTYDGWGSPVVTGRPRRRSRLFGR